MQDVELWQRLVAGREQPAIDNPRRVVQLLGELRAAKIERRGPFFALLRPRLTDEQAPVRAATVATLAGVRGIDGLGAIVAALDDEDAQVRAAAVDALRSCAGDEPMRWAHAVFHPRVDVRTAALDSPAGGAAAALCIYLRADPELADKARGVPWPADSLPLVFDFHLRGMLDAGDAVDRLCVVPKVQLTQFFIGAAPKRSRALVLAIVGRGLAPGKGWGFAGADTMDVCLEMIPPGIDGRAIALRRIAEALDRSVLRRRFAVAVLARADRMGWDPELLELAAACDPRCLMMPAIPLAERRIAARGFVLHGDRVDLASAVDDDLLLSLLATVPGASKECADVDLEAGACIASRLSECRLPLLADAVGEDAMLDAIMAGPLRAWAAMCRLPSEDRKLTVEVLLGRVRARSESRWRECVAVALMTWATPPKPKRGSRFGKALLALDGSETREVLAAAERIHRTGEFVSRQKRGRAFVDAAAAHMDRTLRAGLFSELLLAAADPIGDFTRTAIEEVGKRLRPSTMSSFVRAASERELVVLLGLIDEGLTLATDRERALTAGLVKRPEPGLRAWASARLGAAAPEPGEGRLIRTDVHELSDVEVDTIATVGLAELEAALAPALGSPARRVAEALSKRPDPESPQLSACSALVASFDAIEEVTRELARFGAPDDAFMEALERSCVALWQGNDGVPPLAQTVLYRWERHGLAWGEWAAARPGGVTRLLSESLDYDWPRATWFVWRAAAALGLVWRAREPARLDDLSSDALIDLAVDQLETDVGPFAARLLVSLHLAGSAPTRLRARRERVLERGPDMSDETRRELERWIVIDGVPRRSGPGRRLARRLGWGEKRRIRKSDDIPWLLTAVADANANLVKEAAARLTALGPQGQRALAKLLVESPDLPHPVLATETLRKWTDAPALAELRAVARDASRPAQLRFRVALAFAETRGEPLIETAIEAACTPGEAWFRREDWDALLEHTKKLPLARMLARSPHPHAYRPAVKVLLTRKKPEAEDYEALRGFLEGGTMRATDLRRLVARALLVPADAFGLVVALGEVFGEQKSAAWLFDSLKNDDAARGLEAVLEGAFVGGAPVCTEARAHQILESIRVPVPVKREALRRLITDGRDATMREKLVARLPPSHLRADKVGRLAEIFAWGVRRGRELTGRLFRVHMTHKVEDFGYTRMRESRIYVTPLPVLRGDRHGEDIVEALILHEFGHHMFHRGPEAEAVWRRAQTEGLFPILNLVADEHLERNIRALEPEYGDRLKRLASYAFAHSERENKIDRLVGVLLSGSFGALSTHSMGVAYDPESVVVHRGRLLRELERSGQPFARFVRALRMGLGNRSGDPLLQQALDLFDKRFRAHDMEGLYKVAQRLAELYGGAGELAKMFGGHESLEWGERDAAIHGDGIRDDEVQREVERILDPGKRKTSADAKGPGRLAINVGDNDTFDEITSVVPVPHDEAAAREAGRQVRRHADRLRAYLESLGLALVPRRARLRGRAFDRSRTLAVVLRGDPRMLISREIEVHSDLFIGVVVDCSGSMGVGDCMPKAHRFGTLIAEAVKPLRGVDARFFGFTDREIYDAGDADRCSVTSLAAGGGNNDAAALMHSARVAMASKRKSKVLVMISDGLPTECSVGSLRNLVNELSRRHNICCAQVAVRPIEEVCFPHYVELEQDSLDASTRKFGEIVSKLARKAMGR